MYLFMEYFKVTSTITPSSMSLNPKLIASIRLKYPNGIRFDPANKMMLERMLNEPIYDEEIEELKNIMFTNKDGLSFFLDSIADKSTLDEIHSSVIRFVDRFGKYEPKAFFESYKNKIERSIIRNTDDFQDLLVFLLPKDYSNKAMVRLRSGQRTDRMIQTIEDMVVEDYGGAVSFGQLNLDIPGFTEDRLKDIIDKGSKKLAFIDDPLGPIVETIDSFHLPDDFIEVVHNIERKLSSLDIEFNPEFINPILSLHYGYNFFNDHDLTPESFKKVVETFDMIEEDE